MPATEPNEWRVFLTIEVRGKRALRIFVEPECFDLRVPPGTLVEIVKTEKTSHSPTVWMDDNDGPEQQMTVFPEWGSELQLNGVSVYECWEKYAVKDDVGS